MVLFTPFRVILSCDYVIIQLFLNVSPITGQNWKAIIWFNCNDRLVQQHSNIAVRCRQSKTDTKCIRYAMFSFKSASLFLYCFSVVELIYSNLNVHFKIRPHWLYIVIFIPTKLIGAFWSELLLKITRLGFHEKCETL